jgi:hypothetical protein
VGLDVSALVGDRLSEGGALEAARAIGGEVRMPREQVAVVRNPQD